MAQWHLERVAIGSKAGAWTMLVCCADNRFPIRQRLFSTAKNDPKWKRGFIFLGGLQCRARHRSRRRSLWFWLQFKPPSRCTRMPDFGGPRPIAGEKILRELAPFYFNIIIKYLCRMITCIIIIVTTQSRKGLAVIFILNTSPRPVSWLAYNLQQYHWVVPVGLWGGLETRWY